MADPVDLGLPQNWAEIAFGTPAVRPVRGPVPKPPACEGCPAAGLRGGFVPIDRVLPETRLLVYGEAPGATEEIEAKGFVGRSGRLLRGALRKGRLAEHTVAFGNTVLCRPPGNQFPALEVAEHCLRTHQPQLAERQLPLLATGANAVEALSGFRLDVLKTRGSVLPDRWGKWFVATIHPAFISRIMDEGAALGDAKGMSELYPFLSLDAARASGTSGPRIPKITVATPQEVLAHWRKASPKLVSVDIEGGDGKPQIVGVSWERGEVYVMSWDPVYCRALLNEIFASSALPIFHNASYDVAELEEAEVTPPKNWLDTINLAALVDPGIKKNLQTQCLSWVPGTTAWKGLVNHTPPAGWRAQNPETPVHEYVDDKIRVYERLWTRILELQGRNVPQNRLHWYMFYNGLDAAWTLDLAYGLRAQLEPQGRMDYYRTVMQPLQAPLLEMGQRGMPFDAGRAAYHVKALERLERMADRIVQDEGCKMLQAKHDDLESQVLWHRADRDAERANGLKKYSKAEHLSKITTQLRTAKAKLDEGFNIESPTQRAELVYDWINITSLERSTDEEHLRSLHTRLTKIDVEGNLAPTLKPGNKAISVERAASLISALIAGKKWPTWRRNYLSPPLRETPTGPYLITSYSLHRADTGRLASGVDTSDPEKGARERVQQLQNVPKKLRDVVRAEPGRVFIGADWAGIEWALVMYFAAKIDFPRGIHKDILDRFQAGLFDPHRYLASVAYGVPEEHVQKWQRKICKAYTHGYNYDGAPRTLAINAGHPVAVGTMVCDAHDRSFFTRTWKDTTVERAQQRHYVQTPLGWRRYFWDWKPKPSEILASEIQSTAADLMKWVMALLPRGKARPLDYRLLTSTHDSLVIDVPERDVDDGKLFLTGQMQQPIPWLDGRTWRADVKTGESWRAVS